MESVVSSGPSSPSAWQGLCSERDINKQRYTTESVSSKDMQEEQEKAVAGVVGAEFGGSRARRDIGGELCLSPPTGKGLEKEAGRSGGGSGDYDSSQQRVQQRRRRSRATEPVLAATAEGCGNSVDCENGSVTCSRSLGRVVETMTRDIATDIAVGASVSSRRGEEKKTLALAEKPDAKSTSGNSKEQRLFYGAFLLLAGTVAVSQVIALPVLLQMLLYTGTILYIGSHTSLRQNEVDACTGERTNRTESINHTDALLFPVFGSVALVTMYVAYKFLDAAWVNFLLTLYLTAIGFFALGETIHVAIHPFLAPWMIEQRHVTFRLHLPHTPDLLHARTTAPAVAEGEGATDERKATTESSSSYHCNWSFSQLLSYATAGILSCVWLWNKHWVVHNLLAIAFCIQAIGLVSVGNFTVATILLSGLFVYDIFWVFGTDVMVTVAQSFEGPAKLIFPVQLKPWQQSILGLGDIVVPGVLISMCLRFDYWLHGMNSNSSVYSGSNSTTTCETASADGADAVDDDEGDPARLSEATASPEPGQEEGGVLTRRSRNSGKAARAAADANRPHIGQDGALAAAPHVEGEVLLNEEAGSSTSDSSSDPAHSARLSRYRPTAVLGDIVHQHFNKFYFWVVLIFYECGLITTGVVMLLFQHPQPALLYLVPFCLCALFGAAALNGQVKEVLAYTEDDEASASTPAAGGAAVMENAGGAALPPTSNSIVAEEREEEEEGGHQGQKPKMH